MGMSDKNISIGQLMKKVMVQLKYEEIGSWLATHNVPLFYAHEKGFTVIDKEYIENHPKLKEVLEETVKNIEKKKEKKKEEIRKENKKESKTKSSYFG